MPSGPGIGTPGLFLSTLSLRRATFAVKCNQDSSKNFYPRSPCGERLSVMLAQRQVVVISIHALLAESDQRAERPNKARYIFLSTLSLRRATDTIAKGWDRLCNFYPRSPCGERPGSLAEVAKYATISIHALLAESDHPRARYARGRPIFLSTLSLRRATPCPRCSRGTLPISIHALLAESDQLTS